MVKRVTALLHREYNGLHEAAFLLAVSAVGAQILGLIRDRIFAATFGATSQLDVYYAAFRIPDFLYVSVASFVSVSVLIPFIVEKLTTRDHESVKRFLSSIFAVYAAMMFLGVVCAYFAIPYLTGFVVPGFNATAQGDFILLSRILLLSPVLLGLSSFFGSINQASRRFLNIALAPILYNAGIIIGALFFYPSMGVVGLVLGVLLGAFLHLAIQIPSVVRERLMPERTNFQWSADLRAVTLLSLPRTVALGAHTIVIIVLTAIASQMSEGSIAIFTFAYNLQSVPLAIVGASYSVAAFPTLASLFANGERRAFVDHIVTAGRHILFWSIPIASLFIVLRAQIVRSILGAGAFNWEATRLTAAALALFSVSVAAQSLVLLFVRGYYAAGNTRKPLLLNVVSSVGTVLLVLFFTKFLNTAGEVRFFFEALLKVEGIPGTDVLILPLAFSVGALANVLFLSLAFRRDFREHYSSIRRNVLHSFGAAVIMGFVAYQALKVLDDVFDITTFVGIFLQGLGAGIAGIATGILVLMVLENHELRELRQALGRRIPGLRPFISSPDDFER